MGYGAGDGIGPVRGEAAYNFSRDEIGNFFFEHCSDQYIKIPRNVSFPLKARRATSFIKKAMVNLFLILFFIKKHPTA